MSGEVGLDHDAAVRAAAGFTEAGDGLDASVASAATVLGGTRYGAGEVGGALSARHAQRISELLDQVGGVARGVRDLDAAVRSGAAAVVATDSASAGTLAAPLPEVDGGSSWA